MAKRLTKETKAKVEEAKQTLLNLIPQLKADKVQRLEIDYDGESDDGAIQAA
jgi:hypothetical protein